MTRLEGRVAIGVGCDVSRAENAAVATSKASGKESWGACAAQRYGYGYGKSLNVSSASALGNRGQVNHSAAACLSVEVDAFRQSAADHTPVRRIGQPEDIAAAAAFLCSDEPSFISGQTIDVDGGAKLS
ncbi:MAG: SDR family oxidoreductase [Nocardioides sp.]